MAFFEKASQCLKVTVNMVLCGACAHRLGGFMVVLKDDVYWKHQNYPSPPIHTMTASAFPPLSNPMSKVHTARQQEVELEVYMCVHVWA